MENDLSLESLKLHDQRDTSRGDLSGLTVVERSLPLGPSLWITKYPSSFIHQPNIDPAFTLCSGRRRSSLICFVRMMEEDESSPCSCYLIGRGIGSEREEGVVVGLRRWYVCGAALEVAETDGGSGSKDLFSDCDSA